jgi:inner membrane protein
VTDGRRGIAFLSPFSNVRVSFPWQPLPAAPLDPDRFFSPYGVTVMTHEIVWIWLPTLVLFLLLHLTARRRASGGG